MPHTQDTHGDAGRCDEFSYGCLLGLFVGDAAGAPLEFLHETNPVSIERLVQQAMHMGGGGAFNVAAGQLTDDSELAISLLRGLVGVRPQDGFPAEAVARKYNTWMDADYPFDVGGTCRWGFRFVLIVILRQSRYLARLVTPSSIWQNAADTLLTVRSSL